MPQNAHAARVTAEAQTGAPHANSTERQTPLRVGRPPRAFPIHDDAPSGPCPGSPRAFGLLFSLVFALASLWLWSLGSAWVGATATVSVVLLGVALGFPRALAGMNALWFRFGMRLHLIVSPIVLGFVYFTSVVPVGLALRALRRDHLGRRCDRAATSYWVKRDPPGPAPDSMKNQF